MPALASAGPAATSASTGIGGSGLITDSLNPGGVTAPDAILTCATSQITVSGWNAVAVPVGCLTEYNGESVKVTWTDSGVSTELTQQTDGNLVVDAGNGLTWAAGTTFKGNANGPGCLAQFQTNASLVVDNCDGTSIWNSGAHTYPNAVLAFHYPSDLVIYTSAPGTSLWSTNT